MNFSVQDLLGKDVGTTPAEQRLTRYKFYPDLKKNLPKLLQAWLQDMPVEIT